MQPQPSAVLVATDLDDWIEILCESLQKVGLKPIPALTPHTAKQVLATRQVAAAVVELMIPNLGGFEVLDAVRAIGLSIPVVAVSTHLDEELWPKAAAHGADWGFFKPYEADEVAAEVRRLLAFRQEFG